MPSNLKRKMTSGLFWNSIDRFSNQGLSFVFSVLIARIVSPDNYGVIAMLYVFTDVAQVFIEGGITSAIIRKPNLSEEDLSTAFFLNIGVAAFSYVILFCTAPLVASFYQMPLVESVLRWTSVVLLLNSLCIVQQAKLTIDLDFRLQAKLNLFSTAISGVVGLVMAYRGGEIWALVGQMISFSLFRSLLFWLYSKWRPKVSFSKNAYRYLFGYGSKLLFANLQERLYNNLTPIIIGKFYCPTQLGFFSRAQGFAMLPAMNITGILQKVTFPILSKMQDDNELLIKNYRRILRMSAFCVFPLMTLLFAVSAPLIRILLTEKWQDSVPMLQILCFAMILFPIHAINLNLIQVKGRSDLVLKLEIIKRVIGVAIICVTVPLGILAMCYGMVLSSVISLFLNTYYTRIFVKLGLWLQLKDILPMFVNSIIAGGIAYLIVLEVKEDIISLIAACCGATVYYLCSSHFLKSPELDEIISIIKNKQV